MTFQLILFLTVLIYTIFIYEDVGSEYQTFYHLKEEKTTKKKQNTKWRHVYKYGKRSSSIISIKKQGQKNGPRTKRRKKNKIKSKFQKIYSNLPSMLRSSFYYLYN